MIIDVSFWVLKIFLDYGQKHHLSSSKPQNKLSYNNDDFDYILGGRPEQNNIFIAGDNHNYTKYGKLIEKYRER